MNTCKICNESQSIYTCPRCSFKSCSLKCSIAHKSLVDPPCSGKRDPTTHIPMNQYNYPAMVNDYVFLEDVGRKVEQWGCSIVRDRLVQRPSSSTKPMRAGKGNNFGPKDSKTFLSMQLSFRDVDMDVLPDGMERHRLNKSVWVSKKQTALMTLEIVFHANTTSYPQAKSPFHLITHKNDWNRTLRDLINGHLKPTLKSRKDETLVRWLDALVGIDEEESTASPLCVMKRPKSTDSQNRSPSQAGYYKLDWNAKLCKALRQTHFVEFPTIEVMEEGQFSGVLVDSEGALDYHTSNVPRKRRRIDAMSSKKALSSLIGGYGSEGSSNEDSDHEGPSATAAVVDYESDSGETNDEDVDAIGEADETYDEENFREYLDYTKPDEQSAIPLENDDDEQLDWGDSDDDAALETVLNGVSTNKS